MAKRYLNRWLYIAAGVVILLFAGLIYAWSVLAQPIAAEFSDVSKGALSLTFTICMAAFCIGGFVGGLLSKRIDVRINMVAAGVLFVGGFALAAHTQGLTGLYIGYGILAGFGSGLAYNAVMSTVLKWFPDRQGLASGILLMGFGLSSFIVGKVYQAATPDTIGAWRDSFMVMGVLLVAVMVVGSFFVVKPPQNRVLSASGTGNASSEATTASTCELTPVQMVRQPSFWLFFVWAILLSAAGLAVISQGAGVVGQVSAGTIDGGTTATLVGLISIFNGIGRVLFGGLFDKLGQRKTMLLVDVAFAISVLIVIASIMTSSVIILTVGFVCCGLSYGGITPTNSAFISAFYGTKNYPVNFSIINLNLLFASFGGTIAGVLFDATGSYLSTFMALIGAIAVGTLCTVAIRKPSAVPAE